MVESSQEKFRPGENTGRPIGGNISLEPFPQALHSLALSRGYESQLSLARALGYKSNGIVRAWYSGRSAPSPELFGRILVLLRPDDHELDMIAEPYGELLQKGKGNISAGTEISVRIGLSFIKPGLTPFDAWMEGFCKERRMSLKAIIKGMGLVSRSIRQTSASLETFSIILQNAPKNLNLTPAETDQLSEAVAQTIEQRLASGYVYSDNPTSKVLTWQSEIPCRTYTGVQAAKELGLSRERVRQLRGQYSLPYLLTEENLTMLRLRKNKKNVSLSHKS